VRLLRSIILILTVTLCLQAVDCGGASSPDDRYIDGVTLAVEGEYSEARTAFTAALRETPSYGPARVSLKLVNDVLDGKVDREIALHLFTGLSYLHNEMNDEGSAELANALDMNEGFVTKYFSWYATAYNSLGVDYYREEKPTKALFYLNKAIEIDPAYGTAFYNRGLTYVLKKQYNRAIADFSEALEIKPTHRKALYNRGLAYAVKGKSTQALADYNAVIRMVPEYGKAFNSRGILYISRLDNTIDGCSDLERACAMGMCGAYNFSLKKGFCSD